MAANHAGVQIYFINASILTEKRLNAYNQGRIQGYLNSLYLHMAIVDCRYGLGICRSIPMLYTVSFS
ncbi:hypothetical protein L1S32_03965 [Methanogenium sp. S4BF]|nr:hypothetical protein L1S32_03965 [Methanogenium sp. S4BF]